MADLPLYLLRHLEKDLAMMQVGGKSFAVEGSVVNLGYTAPEHVVVLVGRGPIADILREVAVRLHAKIKEAQGGQDPSLN